jgi:hypothetical protein
MSYTANAYPKNIKLPDRWVDLLAQHKFIWFGHRALDCVGLDKFLQFGLVICCDYGLDTDSIILANGADLVSLERETKLRENWTHASLAKLFDGKMSAMVSSALLRQGRDKNILAYTSTKDVEALARESRGNINILATPALIKQALDNKIQFRKILPSIGIEPTPWYEGDLNTVNFLETKRKYNTPFVIQFPIGAGGFQTFFVSDNADLEHLKTIYGEKVVIVSKYIKGMSPNINAVVLDTTVLLSYPSIQLIGAPECTELRTGYCGNDFSATSLLPHSVIRTMYKQTRLLGAWLRQQGFRGLFGIDFVTDGSAIYPVEVNPRFQGSTQLLTLEQTLNNQIPLALAHVVGMMEPRDQTSTEMYTSDFDEPNPLIGAQMILHNQNPISTIVQGHLYPGIYTVKDNKVIFCRQAFSLMECRDTNEFLITCAVPVPGTRVEPKSPLLKIQTHRQILDTYTGSLQPWASGVCYWALTSLALK